MRGNERADSAVQSVFTRSVTNMKVLAHDLIHYVPQFSLKELKS